ncbi:MAG: hypothetical protein EHM46_06600 [Bacteroidetes bacterium]|nr:MAG: hypothetical protein EHM46_06600 [Bacteroidota bacterium]
MGRGRILQVLVIMAFLCGCAGTYSLVEFEILEPATIHFPDQVENLLVLNRAPLSLDVFLEEDRKNMEMKHLRILDTAITNSITRGLLEVLSQSPIRQFRDPELISDRRSDTANLADLVLTKPEVEALCQRYGTDAIVSLELYTMDLNEFYDIYNGSAEVLTHYYEISNRMIWNIYLPDNPRPYDSYVTVDTLYFPSMVDGILRYTPSVLDMIRELFNDSGMKYGKYLVPMWMNASRTLFQGKDKSLRLAGKLTADGKWEEAFRLWSSLSGSADSTTAAKSLHNMAVYYELEDHLDSASLLINRSLELDSLEITSDYREEMDVRLMNRREVIQQVER